MNQPELEVGRRPVTQRTKLPDDAPSNAINHWIRVEALAIFHEGEFSAGEVADMLGEDVKNVRNHIRNLYSSGCIEFAGYKVVNNYRKPVFRAIVLPVITDEVANEMSVEERHDVSGAITQGILAETMCSYRNGKLDEDPVCLMWGAPNLDAQGEKTMHAHMISSWEEAKEIEAESTNRMAESGEEGKTFFVGLLGFGRGRPGRPEGGYFKNTKK